MDDPSYDQVWAWDNLLAAWRKAARGKRGHGPAAAFEHRLADNLLELQSELRERRYRPGTYTHFFIHEPKRRKISAAPFRDRVLHHALVNVVEPAFERRFIADSYANRIGKGTHGAVDRLQHFARRYPYVLRLDIVRHFPSIDHAILRRTLANVVHDPEILWLIDRVLASGVGVLGDQYSMTWFPGDDLWAVDRPRGLPIGNLTSQFWSNCYLDPLDQFVKRELRCGAYLRYVDDFALCSDSKPQLWRWKAAIEARLATLRLTCHAGAAQVAPAADGIPWLGFVVFPTHRRVKGRNVVNARRRLDCRIEEFRQGSIGFGDLNASVQGWVNHLRYADSWGLRRHVFAALPPIIPPDRR